jgi:ribosomal subunit interface protein
METRITARHCEVSEALHNRARAVALRFDKQSPHALNATFIFGVNPTSHTVEIVLHARGKKTLKGKGQGPDHRTALDRAEEKLRTQLEKATAARERSRRKSPRGDASPV